MIALQEPAVGVRPQLGRFRNQAEYVGWGSKGNMRNGRRESVRKADKQHLTGKPSDLVRQLIRVCEEGGHMLNPFAGYGTTLVAADLEGSGSAIEATVPVL